MTFQRRHLAQMLVLIAVAAAVGLAVNFFSAEPLPLLRPLPAPVSAMPTVGEVDADFVDQVRGASATLLVDARAAAAYRLGHVPGALSLPLGEFAEGFSRWEAELRQADLLILYCSDPTCSDSPELARRLWDKGLRKILLFKGGMEEWIGRGHAVEK